MGQLYALGFGFFLQDRDAGLHVRGLDIGDQAPFEPVAEPVLQARNLLRELIRSYDDLLVRLVK